MVNKVEMLAKKTFSVNQKEVAYVEEQVKTAQQ